MRKKIALVVVLLIILYGAFIYYAESSGYGTHLGLDYLNIDGENYCGQISNIGNQNV